MAANVLPLFWQLSSTDKAARLNASQSLISALETFQKTHTNGRSTSANAAVEDEDEDMESSAGEESDLDSDESGVEVDADEKVEKVVKDDDDREISKLDKQFEASNSEDVRYSIKRLVRGLASSRENSRFGFAVALTELLARIDTLSPKHIISLVVRGSQTSNAMKGTEERDNLFARLFGLASIIESGMLFGTKATLEDFKICLGELMALGEKKSWIRESAWWTVLTGIKGLLTSQVEWKDAAISAVLQRVYGTDGKPHEETAKKARGMEWTQEKAALTLVLQNSHPELPWKVLLAPTFKNGSILSSGNLSTLGKLLKETNESVEPAAPSGAPVAQASTLTTGSWKPQVHFVWDIILDFYFKGSSDGLKDKASFQEFYKITVDETLFSPSSSPQRKYWGFEIISKVLPVLSNDVLPTMFTQNFMKCWMNHLSSEDRYLHKAALRVAKQVQEVTKANSMVGFALLSQLLGSNGSRNFDKVTKTKTVENIMGNLSVEGVQQYVSFLTTTVLETPETDETDGSSIETRRAWAFDQLLALIRSPTLPKEDAWVSSVLDFLLVHGLFVLDKVNKKSKIAVLHTRPQPPLSEASAAVSRARFYSAIIELTVQVKVTKDEDRPGKLQSCDSQGTLWLSRAFSLIHDLEKDNKHVSLAVDVDEEIVADRAKAVKALKGVRNASSVPADVKKGLEILLTFGLLQSYGDDVKAYESLEDIVSCVQILSQPTASSSTSEAPLPPLDLLVDVLIAYLDKASNDLKSLASLVFGLVSSEVKPSTVEHLIAQLEQSGGGNESDDEDEMEVSGEDGEDAAEDDKSASESEAEDEENDLKVDPEFRRRVAEALQVAGMADGEDIADEGDEESGEDEDDDDSDKDSIAMDDDEMLALDEKLASIFKERRSAKKGNNTAEALHFKLRVLDLVEIYLRKQPTNPLIYTFIPTLLDLSQASAPTEKSIAEKAKAILSRRFDKSEAVPVLTEIENVKQILESVHKTAQRSKEVGKACSTVSIFISKSFHQSDLPGASEAVTEIYKASLKDLMTRKNSKLSPTFIQDYISRQVAPGWTLREDVLNYAKGEEVNDFHHVTALTLLSAVAKQFSNLVKAGHKEEVALFVESCRKVLYEALETKASAEGTWNAPRVKEVIKACLQIARFSQSIYNTPAALATAWSVEDLRNLNASLKQTERLKNTPSVLTLMAQLMLLVDPEAKAASVAKKQQKQADKKRKLETTEDAEAAPVKKGGKKGTKKVEQEQPKKKKAKKSSE